MQSTWQKLPGHLAVIMDGNGRWGQARGLPRTAGHVAGVKAVRTIVETAVEIGIQTLTLFAFSSDNFQRPRREVEALMRLLERYLDRETPTCVREGIRLRVIGARERLPDSLVRRIDDAERATDRGERSTLRIAVDYCGRRAILQAAQRAALSGHLDLETLDSCVGWHPDGSEPALPVDLMIRTGGEKRLSDFLLWECAYAELYFTDTLWPDFGRSELFAALDEFDGRERRFGRVLKAAS